MSENLRVSVSPHLRGSKSTTTLMLDVVIALIPALIASVLIFGFRALLLTAVCVGICVLSEYLFQLLCKRPVTVCDLSAVVTGILLAFNLPVTLPIWQAVIGSIIAIIVVKQLFGGIGMNFANPAITARIIMLIAFSGTMTHWIAPKGDDLTAVATPLVSIAQGEKIELLTLFLGKHGGCMGETCAFALLIGGIYLVIRKVITVHTPLVFIATVFILSFIAGGFEYAISQILSGGLMIGAIFMATDYVTSPVTPWGKVVFGFGCGLVTFIIRFWGSYPEGVSFSILLMNFLVFHINNLTAKKPLGGAKA